MIQVKYNDIFVSADEQLDIVAVAFEDCSTERDSRRDLASDEKPVCPSVAGA